MVCSAADGFDLRLSDCCFGEFLNCVVESEEEGGWGNMEFPVDCCVVLMSKCTLWTSCELPSPYASMNNFPILAVRSLSKAN